MPTPVTYEDLWIIPLLAVLVLVGIVSLIIALRRSSSAQASARDAQPVEPDPKPAPISAEAPRSVVVGSKGTPERVPSLIEGLSKTRTSFFGRITTLLSGAQLKPDILEDLEEILYTADLGVPTASALLTSLRDNMSKAQSTDPHALKTILAAQIRSILGDPPQALALETARPFVLMVVGVNGVGKTTTIGKLAAQFSAQGKKVVIAAADTFRAAAIEQLKVWADRAHCEVIAHQEGADPAAVAFDGAKAAKARNADILIVDTAGRLHTKVNLMEELKKVERVMSKEIPGAPHSVLLVVDATTGQNALAQAKQFGEGVRVDGIALTKLDGTAKGGIVVAIRAETGIPVRWIGIGEGIADLRPFDPSEFVDALFAA